MPGCSSRAATATQRALLKFGTHNDDATAAAAFSPSVRPSVAYGPSQIDRHPYTRRASQSA